MADLFIRKIFSTKRLKIVDSPNILPAKLSRYMVYEYSGHMCYAYHIALHNMITVKWPGVKLINQQEIIVNNLLLVN